MEEKRLRRRWARVSIVLVISGAGCILLGLLLGRAVYPWKWTGGLIILGSVLLVAALMVKYTSLRCPSCGKGAAMPLWNPGKRFYCPCCGKPFLFDDEPDEIEKEHTKEE